MSRGSPGIDRDSMVQSNKVTIVGKRMVNINRLNDTST